MLICLFILIAFFVSTKANLWFDSYIINIVRDISDYKTFIYNFITFFASGAFFAIMSILIFIFVKNKRLALFVVCSVLLGALINNFVFKLLFARNRPSDMIVNESGYSFPSGHSMTAAVFYGFIIYLVYNSDLNKNKKLVIIAALISLIVLIAISRIYLGVHYPSDVVAGVVLGIIYLIITTKIYEKIKE